MTAHLDRRLPVKHGHLNTVRATRAAFHLQLNIFVEIGLEMVVETLIAAIAALCLAVMLRCPRLDRFMLNIKS